MTTIRSHPVLQLLREAAQGGRIRDVDLDKLELSAEQRRQVAAAAKAAAELSKDGEKLDARRHADETAFDVIASLPEEQQQPDWYRQPEETPTDPAALAARVARW